MARAIDAGATCAQVHEQQTSPTTARSTVAQDVPQIESEDPQREALSWNNADVTHLSPSALPLVRAPRAWERKPQSPFSRGRLKVGKVWKRAIPTQSSLLGQSNTTKRFQMFSPSQRAVKKIRLEDGPGVSVGWETLGLPGRRITTRASRLLESEPAELEQLPEEETGVAEVQHDPDRQNESPTDSIRDSEGGWEDVEHCLDQDDVDRAVASGEEVLDVTDIECAPEEVFAPASNAFVTSRASILGAEEAAPHAPLDTKPSHSLDVNHAAEQPLDELEHKKDPMELETSNSIAVSSSSEISPEEVNVFPINEEAADPSAKVKELGHDPPVLEQKPRTPRRRSPQRRQVRDLASPASLAKPLHTAAKVPDGFATPTAERRRRPIAEVRRVGSRRRQTLPMNFVALETSMDVPDPHREKDRGDVEVSNGEDQIVVDSQALADASPETVEVGPSSEPASTEMEVIEEELAEEQGDAEDWEDIVEGQDTQSASAHQSSDDEGLHNNTATLSQGPNFDARSKNESSGSTGPYAEMELTGDIMLAPARSEQGALPESIDSETPGDLIDIDSHTQDSSHNAEEEHPEVATSNDGDVALHNESLVGDVCELPLRRSPRRTPSRRKSSSPAKSRSIKSAWDAKPHLVAFTPVKLERRDFEDDTAGEEPQSPNINASSPIAEPESAQADDLETSTHKALDSPSGIASGLYLPASGTSAMAPSARQESPRRSRQPRISDDTLLLQAFLDRAAESKSRAEQRTASDDLETKRQMTGNLAGVDAVTTRENEVLKDLDPNSPSPRKQKSVAPKTAHAEQQKDSSQDLPVVDVNENIDGTVSPDMAQKKRRSARARKQAESTPNDPATTNVDPVNSNGPNKISIRSTSGDAVVLRKTEAQELAILTRANTRRNKGTAMMPCLRLARLGDDDELGQGHESESRAAVQDSTKPKRKGVRWAETLEAFQDSETSLTASVSATTGDIRNVSENAGHPANGEPAPARVRKLKPRLTPRPTITAQFADDQQVDTNSPDPISSVDTASSQKFEDAGVVPMPAIPKVKRRSRLATPAKIKGASASVLALDPEENATLTSIPVTEVGSRPAAPDLKAPSVAPPKRSLISKLPAPVSALTSTMSNAMVPNREKEPVPSLIASPPKKRTRLRSSTRQQQRPQLLPDNTGLLSVTNKTATSSLFGAGASMAKLEFQRPEMTPSLSEAEPQQSLAGSPAKKAPRLFHAGPRSVLPTESARSRDTAGVMSSPAKKRGRRV